MNIEDNILNRIERLLEKGLDKRTSSDYVPYADTAEVSLAATDIFTTIYGASSPQLDMVKAAQEKGRNLATVQILCGYLRELREVIADGLIVNIQSEARGEALGDFLVLARESLDAEQKDVAAVLACAALEDALKRCANDRGLNVQDKNMNEVVNALKAEGVLRKNEGALLSAFVKLRNDAFHARWAAIDTTSVTSIIAFTEEFLAKQF